MFLFVALGVALGWAAPDALRPLASGYPSFTDLLVGVLSAIAVCAYCWLALTAVLTVVAASSSVVSGMAARAAQRLAPTAWRETVLAACGCAVAVLPVTTAWGVGVVQPTAAAAAGSTAAVGGGDRGGEHPGPLAGLPLPDRPVAGRTSPQLVVVRPGDSLWAITARELGPYASDARIAHRWPQWYRANRDVIGADPDLILPGTVLQSPPAPSQTQRGER